MDFSSNNDTYNGGYDNGRGNGRGNGGRNRSRSGIGNGSGTNHFGHGFNMNGNNAKNSKNNSEESSVNKQSHKSWDEKESYVQSAFFEKTVSKPSIVSNNNMSTHGFGQEFGSIKELQAKRLKETIDGQCPKLMLLPTLQRYVRIQNTPHGKRPILPINFKTNNYHAKVMASLTHDYQKGLQNATEHFLGSMFNNAKDIDESFLFWAISHGCDIFLTAWLGSVNSKQILMLSSDADAMTWLVTNLWRTFPCDVPTYVKALCATYRSKYNYTKTMTHKECMAFWIINVYFQWFGKQVVLQMYDHFKDSIELKSFVNDIWAIYKTYGFTPSNAASVHSIAMTHRNVVKTPCCPDISFAVIKRLCDDFCAPNDSSNSAADEEMAINKLAF